MKILIIGGTGTISTAITALLASRVQDGLAQDEIWVLNRGNRIGELPEGVKQIIADEGVDGVSEPLRDENARDEIIRRRHERRDDRGSRQQ